MQRFRSLIIALGCIALIVAIMACGSFVSRTPEDHIRATLLARTPLGTSFDDVQHFVEKQGWKDCSYDRSSGFLKQDHGPSKVVGTSSIRANFGDHHTPLRTNITVFWGFDSGHRLIDIWVWKTVDAP